MKNFVRNNLKPNKKPEDVKKLKSVGVKLNLKQLKKSYEDRKRKKKNEEPKLLKNVEDVKTKSDIISNDLKNSIVFVKNNDCLKNREEN